MITDAPAGSTLSFTVTDFINPYSTAPRSGFTLATYDEGGCIVESADDLTISVSEWATITTAAIDRVAGDVTTVQELSSMIASFTLDLPVDSGCRLIIDFPDEQPLTADLTSVTGTGLFSNAASVSRDIPKNQASIDGCPSD